MRTMYFLYIIIIGLFVSIYFLPIKIFIKFCNKDNNELKIYIITLMGMINYKINYNFLKSRDSSKKYSLGFISKIKRTKSKKTIKKDKKKFSINELINILKNAMKNVKKYDEMIRTFIDKIQIKEIKMNTEFDNEDAAITGIVTGILYTIQSNIMTWILLNKKVEKFDIELKPLFEQKNKLYIQFSCIIQFTLGQIIFIGFKLLKLYFKGGDMNGRTSN